MLDRGVNMAKRARKSHHLYEYAKRGAEFRLRELMLEAELLFEMFPHLRDTVNRDELPLPFLMATRSGAAATKPVSRKSKKKA
jgi:hypothetical protein